MSNLYLYTGQESNPNQVGLAYVNYRHNKLTSTFSYSHDYLESPTSYQIDPTLELRAGNWPVVGELPGCILDSTPDRWGRNLINKQFPGHTLNNLDYLLAVNDISRQGALRYKTDPNGSFLHPDTKVPKLMTLPELLDAANAIDNPRHSKEAVKYLLDAGSGSLGGARPKAVVEKDGHLFLAKFPHKNDQTNVIADEYHALVNAGKKGMDVPPCQLVKISGSDILLIQRFDRKYDGSVSERVGYLSAMSALGAVDGEQRDYLEIIDFISMYGSRPKGDIQELLRRVRYTIEINNTDDHLRNHGFIHEKGGWHLSPLFDINPNPNASTHRQTALGGATDAEDSLKILEKLELDWG